MSPLDFRVKQAWRTGALASEQPLRIALNRNVFDGKLGTSEPKHSTPLSHLFSARKRHEVQLGILRCLRVVQLRESALQFRWQPTKH